MIIKEKYDINESVYTYESLSHKVMFTQMKAKNGIKLFEKERLHLCLRGING